MGWISAQYDQIYGPGSSSTWNGLSTYRNYIIPEKTLTEDFFDTVYMHCVFGGVTITRFVTGTTTFANHKIGWVSQDYTYTANYPVGMSGTVFYSTSST